MLIGTGAVAIACDSQYTQLVWEVIKVAISGLIALLGGVYIADRTKI